jgi:ribosome maturation factor RimP
MADALKQRVTDLISGPLVAEGYELADMALSRYHTSVLLRLFVYAKGGGPTLEECARLSNVVGTVIDGTDLFESGYTLEVSSPGLERPLTTARDFTYRAGETVRIEFVDHKRKKQTAEIVGVTEDRVEFRDENGSFSIPLEEIERARIVF